MGKEKNQKQEHCILNLHFISEKMHGRCHLISDVSFSIRIWAVQYLTLYALREAMQHNFTILT